MTSADVAIPVETAAGEVAQVDFGYVGKLYDASSGRLRTAWVFVMVLGYSRRMVVRTCFDQKIETWLRVHVEAFAELGGAPSTIVPDNLKAAIVRAAFGVDGAASLNRSCRELARHYGIKIDPAPIYAPKEKGKVEPGVKYVNGDFFTGRGGNDVDNTKRELQRWVDEIANQRIHGTTRRRPIDLLTDDERAALRPMPKQRYELVAGTRHLCIRTATSPSTSGCTRWRLLKQGCVAAPIANEHRAPPARSSPPPSCSASRATAS